MKQPANRIPLWLKIAYTAFMALMIPVYLKNYGITNFLYFCDVAAIATLIAIWVESPLWLSAMLIGAFIPQMLWVVDFCFEAVNAIRQVDAAEGVHLTSMTSYMFNSASPFFLRFLSFFHFWLVFLLIFVVWRVGYDKRGLILWMGIAWILLTVCYVWMPPPSPTKDADTGAILRDANQPANINYVYGLTGEEKAQTAMEPNWYFALYMMVLMLGIYPVTHVMLWAAMPTARDRAIACA